MMAVWKRAMAGGVVDGGCKIGEEIFETASKKRGGERVQITRFYSNMFRCLFDVFFRHSADSARERSVRYRRWCNSNRI